MIQEFTNLGIQLKGNSPQQKTKCPKCSLDRKNKLDTPLSVNLKDGVFKCHHCNWQGRVGSLNNNNYMENKVYSLPSENVLQPLSGRGKEFLNSRGITDDVIQSNNIKSSSDGSKIVFPYYREGKLINYKTRGIDGKHFTQAKDAEAIVYNYDSLVGSKDIVISEGEIDSLSWAVAGVRTHTSVNMGAPNVQDKNIEAGLAVKRVREQLNGDA